MTLSILATAIISFAATNIDDIFLLAIFFSQTSRRWQVIVGQYLGFSALVIISLTGFIGVSCWIRNGSACSALSPIVIGIKKLFARAERQETPTSSGVIDIALITFANGGDNIGIYAPLFATANGSELRTFLAVFYLMLAVWCYVGYLIGRHPLVALVLKRYGRWIVPFGLIGLGLYILIDSRL